MDRENPPEELMPATSPDEQHEDADVSLGGARGVLGNLGRMVVVAGPVAMPLRGLAAAFHALRHRDYRLLWFGAMSSNMGTWIANLAKSWLVFEFSQEMRGDGFWLGVDAFILWIPMILLLPASGVLADRFDQRRVLQFCNLVLMCVSAAIALLHATGLLRLWHLLVMSAVLGTMQALAVPSNQALLPRLVGIRDLPNAVALNAMQFNISRAIGPAIGGYALAQLGATGSFIINALTFVIMLAVLGMIQPPPPERHRRPRSVFKGFAEAVRYVRGRSDLIMIETMVFLTAFCIAPLMYMLPPLALVAARGDRVLSQSYFGMMLSSFGAGAIVGAILLAARSREAPAPWRAFPTLLALGAVEVLISVPGLPFVAVALLLSLAGMMMTGTLNRLFAIVLASVPSWIRGRCASIHLLVFSLGLPTGSLCAGYLEASAGILVVFKYYGLVLFIMAAVLGLTTRRLSLEYQPHEEPEHAR